MRYGLNGWHDADVLREVKRRGFELLRFGWLTADAQYYREATDVIDRVRACVGPPLVIVRDGVQVRELNDRLHGCDVELWNEPDGHVDGCLSSVEYAALVPDFLDAADEVGARPWIGAISNLTQKALGWLRQMMAALPDDVRDFGVTVHRYPNGQTWRTPHHGFDTRLEEVAALRAIIGARRFAVSEFGFHTVDQRHTAKLPYWFPRNRWRWTDLEVAALVRREFQFWRWQGAEFAVLYQIMDGPTNTKEDRFGIRRIDGRWKPVADVLWDGD